MSITCTKNLSILIVPPWVEYTGVGRHAGPFFTINPGDPNFVCAPHTISLVVPTVSVYAVCNLPIVDPAAWTWFCYGCGHQDTGTFEYAASLNFMATVAGTCAVLWNVDIRGIRRNFFPAVIDVFNPSCSQASGLSGTVYTWLDTRVNGVLVDSHFEQAASDVVHPDVHTVASHNLLRHLNVGDSIFYMFQIFATAAWNCGQLASATFSFTPDP